MTADPVQQAPQPRAIPGEPLEEPSSHRNNNGPVNGNGHAPGVRRSLLVVAPLGSRPGAPIALAEGQEAALRLLQAALPPEWLPAAIPPGMWTDIDWAPLIGRRPVIVPANSAAGAQRASQLEDYLRKIGIAASILPLPDGLPEGWRIEMGFAPGQTLLFETSVRLELGTAFSAIDLAAAEFPELRWVIEGWLPIGLGLLVGPPKLGKSFLAMDFAVKVARGQQVFGKINTLQTDVLYMALEDPPRRLADRMRKMLGSAPPPRNLTFWTQCEKLDCGGLDRLNRYLDALPSTKLVMIDTWAKVRGEPKSQKGVYNADYDDVGVLHKLANEREIALLMLHHTRKQDATDIFDTISGSQGVAGAADTLMVLKRPRGEPNGQFAVTGRDISEDGLFAVRFDKETCLWSLLGEAKEVKRENDQQRVYETLFAAKNPMRIQEIADESEIGVNTVRSALQRLRKRGSLRQVDHGQWGIVGRDYTARKNEAD